MLFDFFARVLKFFLGMDTDLTGAHTLANLLYLMA